MTKLRLQLHSERMRDLQDRRWNTYADFLANTQGGEQIKAVRQDRQTR